MNDTIIISLLVIILLLNIIKTWMVFNTNTKILGIYHYLKYGTTFKKER